MKRSVSALMLVSAVRSRTSCSGHPYCEWTDPTIVEDLPHAKVEGNRVSPWFVAPNDSLFLQGYYEVRPNFLTCGSDHQHIRSNL